MLTIGKLAKQANVSVDTIRHYVDINLLQPKRNPENDYQLFNPKDVNRLEFIKHAKNLGFTLKELKEIFTDADKGDSPCPRVRKIVEAHLEENRKKINALQDLQHRMENALKAWESLPDGCPDGTSICHLIESQ